jgi:pimeloyl-ACP methyl ester carboxylesterase
MQANIRCGGVGASRIVGFHGWFGPENSWAGIDRWLDPLLFSWVFPDLRGYGRRRHDAGSYTLEEAAEDSIALADSLGWDSFSVIGHSMGALAGQWLVAQYPHRVQKLIAVTPVPAGGVPFDEATKGFFSQAADDLSNRKSILDGSTGGKLHSCVLDVMLKNSTRDCDANAFRRYFEAWSSANFAHLLQGAKNPTKVIVGGNDPFLTVEVMRGTFGATFASCDIVSLPGCGHYPMIEAPLQFVGEVTRFLQ